MQRAKSGERCSATCCAASYGPVFELDLTRATRGQFHEAFRRFGAREGVLAKCEAFFIQAARDAGIGLSQYITAGRHGARRPTAPRAPRSSGQSERTPPPSADSASTAVHPGLALAQRILEKYPDFDPSWSPDVQASWLNGMTRLYEGLSAPVSDGPPVPVQTDLNVSPYRPAASPLGRLRVGPIRRHFGSGLVEPVAAPGEWHRWAGVQATPGGWKPQAHGTCAPGPIRGTP